VVQDSDAFTVVYIDFRKGFDTVSHPKLMSKLYGIHGSYCRGSRNTFMTDHTVRLQMATTAFC